MPSFRIKFKAMTSYDHECSIFIAERVEFAFAHPLAAASFLAEKIKIFVQVNLAQLFTFFCGKSGIQTPKKRK